jgi:hypothetical protein
LVTIYFQSSFTKNLELNVFDLFGILIRTININTLESYPLNIHDLTPGIYFFKLTSGSISSDVKKFVKN